MNAPFVTRDRVAERDAFLSLALTMRRSAHRYRQWAREAEARGDLDGYRHCTKEAERCWRSAKWNLRIARREADYAIDFMEKHYAENHASL